jgi:peptidoglycan/LPS O-acetylase OafA/YrhL
LDNDDVPREGAAFVGVSTVAVCPPETVATLAGPQVATLPTPRTTPGRLVSLDVLRALAIALVLGSHLPTTAVGFAPARSMILAWQTFGWTGVDLFFVLSGFLVSGLLFQEYARTRTVRPVRFLIRRGLKIYPGFYVLFGVTLIVRLVFLKVQTGTWAALAEATFVQNYHVGLLGHTWSLAVEEHFYILLALVLTYILTRAQHPLRVLERLFIVVPIVVLALRFATDAWLPFQHHTHHWPTHLRIDSLLFGVMLSYLAHLQPTRFAAIVRWRVPLLCVGVLLIMPPFFLPASAPFIHTVGYTFLYLGYGAVLVFALTQGPGPWTWLGSVTRGVAWLGAYSYSIYLWHAPFEGWIMPSIMQVLPNSATLAILVYVVGACALGVAMARLVEFPALALRDRVFPRSDRAIG